MKDTEMRAAAKQFAEDWRGRGDEKQETQSFWLALLLKIFGIEEPEKYMDFERRVEVDDTKTGKRTTKFIDAYIPETRVLIEQKGMDINLRNAYSQSDGSMLTPYQQARRYGGYLPQSEQPRWIIVCNFQEFHIHDMNRPNDAPEVLKLEDLEKEYHRLAFIVDSTKDHIKKEMEVSLKAGELVGVLYNALLKQYIDPEDAETLKNLNALCVRLVFCLYAEDAGIFGHHQMFHDYLKTHENDARRALIDLFKVLDQKPEERDPYMDEDLAAFPYVNGGLFSDERIVIPRLSEDIVDLLLNHASEDFDWSEISPTIFGAVFESTLNPETRRKGGMHYTSIENIHKVIDPLFLNALTEELDEICDIAVEKTRKAKLQEFQQKLAGLTFLDPACGSGNFLTETYLSLRRLENRVIAQLNNNQVVLDATNPIKVSIGQFYGIEINDFAVTVAKTALWIAESQMMKETEQIVSMAIDFLPLKSYANIVEGNALQIDWEDVVSKEELDYIMGNPPFIGYAYQTKDQKDDLAAVTNKACKNIDYVVGWYYKASQLMIDTKIRTAFVSTNSITQGEQVSAAWKPLYNNFYIHIDFAHRTFRWDSEATDKAQVHCVIIGFSTDGKNGKKALYSNDRMKLVDNINFYLNEGPTIFIDKRTNPLCDVTPIIRGSSPNDDGNLLLLADEYREYIQSEPQGAKFIRPFMMGRDFILRKPRYCFWLVDANPTEVKKCPLLLKRIEAVKEFRSKSKRTKTLQLVETPMLFEDMRISEEKYIAIPKVSSERRKYIPIDYLKSEVIPGDKLFFMKNASLFDFGILTSNVHNAWMRTVAGRLKSDYSYSNTIVYNNFPWPTPTDEQKAKIEKTAQAILDARDFYPDASLADLYDELTMPPELRKAHRANDRAVMDAYGFDVNEMTETTCVEALMKMYQELTENEKK